MLYLEDYLELIEHLPQELRDRFTDIRERDLQVHNSSEQLSERVQLFFAEAKDSTTEQRQCSFQKLLGEYQETMKYADDSVQITTQMHEILIKLVQRLETELEKFKLELEADHAGITEELEKRSLELDADSRLDDLINNQSANLSLPSGTSSKLPSSIKDRRRSEHKHYMNNRHHPYQNNHTNNGYHGRAKLSNQNPHHQNNEHHRSKSSLNHTNHHRQGSKFYQNSRQHQAFSPDQTGTDISINSAPASVSGDANGLMTGYYGNNLSSFGNNTGFKNSSSKQFNHQHSALSAALASNNPKSNSLSALAMMNATSVHNKISNNNIKGHDLIDPNSPLIRQNPLAAAASQAIAATQQLQQGRRTPSLKASFAAINAAGLAPLDGTGTKHDSQFGINRNALAPVTPDQQAYRYAQYGKMSNNSVNGSTPGPLYVSVTKSGRPTKRPRHHASHLYPDESPTSISSDNSVFENSESLSSADFIETGTNFGSTSPSSLDFATSHAQGNTNMYTRDETLYCHCRQISYGEMVACDNKECEYEWFHYGCVGVTQSPKGKWYCPDCQRKMTGHQQSNSHPQTQKKRGRKEKSLFNLVNNSIDIGRAKDGSCEQNKSVV